MSGYRYWTGTTFKAVPPARHAHRAEEPLKTLVTSSIVPIQIVNKSGQSYMTGCSSCTSSKMHPLCISTPLHTDYTLVEEPTQHVHSTTKMHRYETSHNNRSNLAGNNCTMAASQEHGPTASLQANR